MCRRQERGFHTDDLTSHRTLSLNLNLLPVPVLPGFLFSNENRLVDHARPDLGYPGRRVPGKHPPMRSPHNRPLHELCLR